MKTTKEKIAIMQAFEDGREIERSYDGETDWILTKDPVWDWRIYDYRIKDESKPVLMTQRQLCELLAKGYGEFMVDDEMETELYPTYFYSKGNGDKHVADNVRIRPWDSKDWLVPTKEVYECFVGLKAESVESDEDGKVYKVGEWGQAGWVFYDKGEYSDGWRYMEAAPCDLRVVEDVPKIDPPAKRRKKAKDMFMFGYYRKSIEEDDCQNVGTDTSIGSGRSNTQKLVDAMDEYAYTYESGGETAADYAAMLCFILEYRYSGVVYDDWFLPSRDELNLMYENLKMKGLGSLSDSDYGYWSSSESGASSAWGQYFSNGDQDDYYRCNSSCVRPARCF